MEATGGAQPVAPSPIPCPVCTAYDPRAIPRELSLSEIKDLITAFGAAALRAKVAGFDAVELHYAHGYLVHQFMSPLTNKRTDGYGGDLRERWRFGIEIVEKIKEVAGDDFPIIVRVSGDDAVSDLYIGRLPAATAAEAEVMVNKVIAYENGVNSKSWEKSVLLVADDNDADNEAIFEKMNEDVAAFIPAGMNEPSREYLGDYLVTADLTAEIKGKIRRGPVHLADAVDGGRAYPQAG